MLIKSAKITYPDEICREWVDAKSLVSVSRHVERVRADVDAAVEENGIAALLFQGREEHPAQGCHMSNANILH